MVVSNLSALYILIIASVSVAIGFLIAFVWALRHGQFEDSYTPAIRILFDDSKSMKPIGEKEHSEGSDTPSISAVDAPEIQNYSDNRSS